MQKLRWLRENWLQALILVIPFIVIAAAWDRFPERVAVHWGTDGPNGWAGKTRGLLTCPVLGIALALLLGWIPRLDPRLRRNPGMSERSLGMIRLATTALLSFGSVLIAAEALGYHFNVFALGINATLLFLLVFGNYFGTLRPSFFVGVRTPWTLRDDGVWRRTHRNAGRVMVFGALLLLGLQFVLTPAHLATCLFIFVMASPIWSIAYSYWCSRVPESPG